jgi:hypothetical protein
MKLSRLRPSPAMVVAVISLVVAMGGVGYAAATIGSSQIKNNSVRGKDIRNGSVTGKDVHNSSLTGSDVKNNTLGGADVKESTLGKVPAATAADSAANANTVGGLGAGAFERSGQLLHWSKNVAENDTAVLASTAQFDVVAVCDTDGSLPVNTTFDFDSTGTAMGIRNRTSGGEDDGYADTDDDDEDDFDRGEAVAFNYIDNGDGGEAVLPSGHFISIPGFGNTVVDSADAPGISGCQFSGAAFVG